MDMKTETLECNKCILNTGDPDVIVDEDGQCNTCKSNVQVEHKKLLRKAIKNASEFDAYLLNKKSCNYDSLLMLSGGKDSIYMLNDLISNRKSRPLAYTFNHPFESNHAKKNIEKVLNKLNVEHVEHSPNMEIYKDIMRNAFTKVHNEPLSFGFRVKFPCMTCSNYMRINAIIFAYRFEIPYVLYCADPIQMATFDTNTKNVICDFKSACGEELFKRLPERDILEEMLTLEDEKLPKMVFPYATFPNYDYANIIKELKELQIYETSPFETHCSLRSLLSFYTFKRYNSYFYARELSKMIRSNETTRSNAIEYVNETKDMLLYISKADEITEKEKADFKRRYCRFFNSESKLDFAIENLVNLKKTADDLKLDLSSI